MKTKKQTPKRTGAIIQGTVPDNPTVKEIVEHAMKYNGSFQQLVKKKK
jgi:hypothetical protein